MKCFELFKVFFKIGVILLGGGYVIVPVMKQELVEKRSWITNDELLDFYCVSQCLPGIIAINMSILTGYKLLRLKGALTSVFAIVLSPFISIIIIAKLLDKIMGISFIEGVFWGVNLSVIVLIYLALKEMWSKSLVDKFTIFWFILILFSAFYISPAILIIVSILFGIILHFIKENKNVQ